MIIFRCVIAFCVAYLLGSVNSSIIIYRLLTHRDIRDYGSGSAGMTNTLRTLGKRIAALVFIGDSLKAIIAILIARLILPDYVIGEYLAGLGAIIGHNFPIYHDFRGGKGIVVSLVAVLMTDWIIGLSLLIIAVSTMFITGIVSLGSILGAVLIPFATLVFGHFTWTKFTFYLIYGGIAVFMHRANIKRLINGTENSFRKKKKA